MKAANNTRSRQVYSVGNYLMTGKVLGKGHFARVEEATHRIIGKKVAIKIIDLTLIKEEYARRNLHREPRVMARLRHPCIAALYETMMHGPRLYVVMEAAGGGDLCAHVLAARGPARGLPEARARALAAQLVSAVRHMHARGVVHRDLKMENIMLDSTKQFIKIVDFGLSNLWTAGGSLRTPCGSLEYAAPELFVDGRRYGPEVDLWSIGVIVYGMVTGGLPFTGSEGGSGRSRPQLRAAISRGFTRKQRSALTCVTNECRTFVQALLEPIVQNRMKIEEAARHRWIKRPGMRMKVHPLANIEHKVNREMYKQISDMSNQSIIDVIAQIKAEPFGSIAGMYNIQTHLHQIQAVPGVDLLWTSKEEIRPPSPPEYKALEMRQEPSTSKTSLTNGHSLPPQRKMIFTSTTRYNGYVAKPTEIPQVPPRPIYTPTPTQSGQNSIVPKTISTNGQLSIVPKLPTSTNGQTSIVPKLPIRQSITSGSQMPNVSGPLKAQAPVKQTQVEKIRERSEKPRSTPEPSKPRPTPSPRFSLTRPLTGLYGKNSVFKYDSGDCGLDPRLPSIDEHSNTDLNDKNKKRSPYLKKVEEDRRLKSCPNKMGDGKRTEFYRRPGESVLTNWRTGMANTTARILLQSNATTIKRASLG
ncbi:hypothetical protein O0L34_g7462 [Tuta absoluta]|nr:hypothetical protein O0L34_g7462 [Tuta absoluta]